MTKILCYQIFLTFLIVVIFHLIRSQRQHYYVVQSCGQLKIKLPIIFPNQKTWRQKSLTLILFSPTIIILFANFYKNCIFDQIFFLTKIFIFEQKFLFLFKICMLWPIFLFLTKICIFLTKIFIFGQIFLKI